MRTTAPALIRSAVLIAFAIIFCWTALSAQQPTFRNAPVSSTEMKNPYETSVSAITAGKALYAKNCTQCHGNSLQGMGPAPALNSATVRNAKPGELFWFITTGKPASGMPSWSSLSKQQRWQIVSFLQSPPK